MERKRERENGREAEIVELANKEKIVLFRERSCY